MRAKIDISQIKNKLSSLLNTAKSAVSNQYTYPGLDFTESESGLYVAHVCSFQISIKDEKSHFSASIYDRTDKQNSFVGNFTTFKDATNSCLEFMQEKQGKRIEYVNSRIVEAQKLKRLLVGYENDLNEIRRLKDE